MNSCHVLRGHSFVIGLLLCIGANVFAQSPPAQGPPPPGQNPNELGMGIIINGLKQTIQKVLDSTNVQIARAADSTGVTAHVSFTPTVFQPMMWYTTYTDRPNQNIVLNRFLISYDVTDIHYHGIPYFSRKLGQSIEIYTSCNNWFTNNGLLKITSNIQAPFLDGESFEEEALNFFIANVLAGFVDSQLKAAMAGSGTGNFSTTVSTAPCNCLGVEPGSAAKQYTDGAVTYAKTRNRVQGIATANAASVKVKSIRRLNDVVNGAPYYNAVEDVRINLYVNQTLRTAEATGMKEGDERTLSVNDVTFPKPAQTGSVVVIVNIVQESNFTTDSDFAVFTAGNNFGNGTQKLVVRKSYWQPPQRLPNGSLTKPIKMFVDAYELTLQVNIPQMSLLGSH